MKNSKARKKSRDSKAWTERKRDSHRVIEFSEVKGRVVENVVFCTASEYHALVLEFADNTSLTLVIDPCFLIAANFADTSDESQQVLKRWSKIQSMTYEG